MLTDNGLQDGFGGLAETIIVEQRTILAKLFHKVLAFDFLEELTTVILEFQHDLTRHGMHRKRLRLCNLEVSLALRVCDIHRVGIGLHVILVEIEERVCLLAEHVKDKHFGKGAMLLQHFLGKVFHGDFAKELGKVVMEVVFLAEGGTVVYHLDGVVDTVVLQRETVFRLQHEGRVLAVSDLETVLGIALLVTQHLSS